MQSLKEKRSDFGEAKAGFQGVDKCSFTVRESDQITVKFMKGRDHDWLVGGL